MHERRWTVRKISEQLSILEQLVYKETHAIAPFRFKALDGCEQKPLVEKSIDDSDWQIIQPETFWGFSNCTFVLRTAFEVPKTWDKKSPIALYLPLGEAGDFSHPEALAYIDEQSFAACDRHHQEIILSPALCDGKSHLLALHGWTGNGGWKMFQLEGKTKKLLMQTCYLVQIDQTVRNFIATVRVAVGSAATLDDNSPAKGLILNILNDAFNQINTREPFGDEIRQCIYRLAPVIKKEIEKVGLPLDVDIIATGHSHIDVAWLWTVGQTRRKSGRTFHTVQRLMEQFENYHFTQSQPQLYDYVRQDYPKLFEDIKKSVKKGNWEIIGGMWVEADCNVTGSESLARQFLLGRTFFREHFGMDVESPILWLPDVFGYSANLPQLIKLAGLKYFFTSKISCNQYNRHPYDTFNWQGIDGTRVLTHFATTPYDESAKFSTYNGMVTPMDVMGTWTTFQQKELHQQLLLAYGYGDGGGGPTREMLENIRELNNFPSMPRLHQGSAGEFFKKLETACDNNLPVWNGELYLELHRGTYTTQSRNKRENRKAEFLMHDTEFLATLASIIDKKYSYPAADLRKAWELICLNQFHDIIPGSSIGEVYEDSAKDYKTVRELVGKCQSDALDVIKSKTNANVVMINPTSFKRSDLAFVPAKLNGKGLKFANGTDALVQETEKGTLLAANEIEPYSTASLMFSDRSKSENTLIAKGDLLENNFVRVQFDKAGDIISIFDKANNRNVLPTGSIANQFQAFEDRPLRNVYCDLGDAWDIDIYYEDKMWKSEPAESIKVVESGPIRATLEIRRRIMQSEYVQRISLAYNSPQIDFDTEINWSQKHILLKAAFPVEILSSTASFEIQWGHVQRPTHRNTSWDWARFEVCAQKWIDISEGDYGVSLLNDCKYGHDAKENVLRISLLRGTTAPDTNADQGKHQFKYSLLPHTGCLSDSTVSAAYQLNDPLIAVVSEKTGSSKQDKTLINSFVSMDSSGAVIETIKKAENGKGIIVRMYQSMPKRGTVTLTSAFEIEKVNVVNLIEDDQQTLEHINNQVSVYMKPFEIVTLRLIPKKA
jgi:alpha-mannosidase